MNELIKEFAEQSRKKPMGDSWCYTDPREFEQKFAELIVRECAEWVNDNVGLIDEEARADLLKHFGVEL
jgi:hypothetical protein